MNKTKFENTVNQLVKTIPSGCKLESIKPEKGEVNFTISKRLNFSDLFNLLSRCVSLNFPNIQKRTHIRDCGDRNLIEITMVLESEYAYSESLPAPKNDNKPATSTSKKRPTKKTTPVRKLK